MPRSVNSVAAKQEEIKSKAAKIFRKKKKCTIAKNAVEKGLQYAYRDRKIKKKLQSIMDPKN